jgi:hypothetical protein
MCYPLRYGRSMPRAQTVCNYGLKPVIHIQTSQKVGPIGRPRKRTHFCTASFCFTNLGKSSTQERKLITAPVKPSVIGVWMLLILLRMKLHCIGSATLTARVSGVGLFNELNESPRGEQGQGVHYRQNSRVEQSKTNEQCSTAPYCSRYGLANQLTHYVCLARDYSRCSGGIV